MVRDYYITMKIDSVSIENFRSIVSIKDAKFNSLQILIGENNSGKSNLLSAVEVFLSAGAGGVSESDFNDRDKRIVIKIDFKIQSEHLKRAWRKYAVNDKLILEKHIWLEKDERSEKYSVKSEYHGYQAEPADWFLSITKIQQQEGIRPNWKKIVEDNTLPDYFLNNGSCNKADFTKGLAKFLSENEVIYDQPDISHTQALGLQSSAVSQLPKFYLLPAQGTYSDEVDKRSSASTFRKLMADLTDRIIKNDPKYQKIEDALQVVTELLNDIETPGKKEERLISLSTIEDRLKTILCELMPSVEKIKLKVITEDIKTIFSKGVELTIDDGVETEVLLKGHGLQRCIIFSLLQALILNERKELVEERDSETPTHPIILAIEEPELYIHPQIGKLFYDVMLSFSEEDQIMYTTHSPRFLDVYRYESIALISKKKTEGTQYVNCDLEAFSGLQDKKIFQGLTLLNSDINELFFAKNVLLVEGPEDKIAIGETLKMLGEIKTRPEEIELTIVVAGGKYSMPFFCRILNAFQINYVVVHDLDVTDGMDSSARDTTEKANVAIKELALDRVINFPIKLENTMGFEKNHFTDQYTALKFFQDHANINLELQRITTECLTLIESKKS